MRNSKWMRFLLIALSAMMVLSLFACGNGGTGEETTVEDTTVEDTTVEDTTVEDTTVEDTNVEDTTVEDTTVEDTTVEDTTVEDTTEEDTTEEETTVAVEAPNLPMYTNAENLWFQIYATHGEGGAEFGKVELSADSSYVTVTNSASHESYFHLFSDNFTVTGQYFVMKYRTTSAAGSIQIYSATEGWITCGVEQPSYINDGEWHIMVLDLTKWNWNNDGAGKFEANADGEYAVQILRVDIFNENSSPADTKSIDIAYMAMCGDDNMAEIAVGEEDAEFYTVYSNGLKKHYDFDGKEITDITPFDIYVSASDLANWGNCWGIGSKVLSDDGSYVTFAPQDGKPEGLLNNLYAGGSVTGRYAVLKYRIPTNSVSNSKYIRIYTSSTNAGPTGGDNFDIHVVADGQWHVVIIDLAQGATVAPNGDGEYAVKYVRLDIFPTDPSNIPTVTASDRIDIAYFGITYSIESIAENGLSSHGVVDASIDFTFEGTINGTAFATDSDNGPMYATAVSGNSVTVAATATIQEGFTNAGVFYNIRLADGTYVAWAPTSTLEAGETFDLSAYAGQTVTLVFAAVPAEYLPTYAACTLLEVVVEVPAA